MTVLNMIMVVTLKKIRHDYILKQLLSYISLHIAYYTQCFNTSMEKVNLDIQGYIKGIFHV